jgi:ABC-type lipoprotein release transport system permease subunit
MIAGPTHVSPMKSRPSAGARRADILAQMLTESVVLSVMGGIVGTVLGA